MPRQKRWTAEVEDAFLVAFERSGSIKSAAAAVGMSPQGANHHRNRSAPFAAEWDRVATTVKARWAIGQGTQIGHIPAYRLRHDGWTEIRQRIFLRALSETGSVRDACKRAVISNTSAYRMRKRAPAFARAWDRALRLVMPTIEQAAFERAVLGWDEPILYRGEVVATRKRYSHALLARLLDRRGLGDGEPDADVEAEMASLPRDKSSPLVRAAHEAARAAGGVFSNPATTEETNAAILKGLAVLDKRLKREKAEKEAEARAATEAGRTIEHQPSVRLLGDDD
jgi:molybdenum-dependent DNA-binding transcriptional regulator ModE